MAWRLILDDHEPVLLREGNTFVLGNLPPYVLASTPDARRPPAPRAGSVGGRRGGFVRIGPAVEDDLYLCAGHIEFDHRNAALLTDLLPPLVVVRAADPHGSSAP